MPPGFSSSFPPSLPFQPLFLLPFLPLPSLLLLPLPPSLSPLLPPPPPQPTSFDGCVAIIQPQLRLAYHIKEENGMFSSHSASPSLPRPLPPSLSPPLTDSPHPHPLGDALLASPPLLKDSPCPLGHPPSLLLLGRTLLAPCDALPPSSSSDGLSSPPSDDGPPTPLPLPRASPARVPPPGRFLFLRPCR